MILSPKKKKVKNSPDRSGSGNKVGRGVDLVLPSGLTVMLMSYLVEDAAVILLLCNNKFAFMTIRVTQFLASSYRTL